VAAKKIAAGRLSKIAGKRYLLQTNTIYCRQTLFIAGKRYLLQANTFFCRHINKLQAGPART
jgi:hypothetical protein